ncbi:hypothetical protein [Cupriavidus oxalaticus]|uniref:Uncharacterized protein n=1 Tax=Cupriavidus oxalaticus TaxID=96344 RepID=A0A4P7LJ01_9BURK|nr:hypothetical protein [Cupriavidus oxalaticus]QBY56130.1 hypothetical protein E0W60_34290 [Cupriavidus oxalaticus]
MRTPLNETTRAKVLDALLAGREINGTLFANEVGTSASNVLKILRQVGDALDFRTARKEASRNRIYCRARDLKQLQLAREAMTYGGGPNQHGNRPTFNFSALLGVWPISPPRDMGLPSLVHRLAPEDDELFSEE